jgi:hypothetical protein
MLAGRPVGRSAGRTGSLLSGPASECPAGDPVDRAPGFTATMPADKPARPQTRCVATWLAIRAGGRTGGLPSNLPAIEPSRRVSKPASLRPSARHTAKHRRRPTRILPSRPACKAVSMKACQQAYMLRPLQAGRPAARPPGQFLLAPRSRSVVRSSCFKWLKVGKDAIRKMKQVLRNPVLRTGPEGEFR